METLCENCKEKDTCQRPCPAVERVLRANNRVFERHFKNATHVFPGSSREVHFSDIDARDRIDEASEPFPYFGSDTRLRKSAVFIERFFNRASYSELAGRFGVTANTVVIQYRTAIEELVKIVALLDMKKTGLKIMASKFSDDEKMFLLNHVYNFSQDEVAGLFNIGKHSCARRIGRMADRYKTLFSSVSSGVNVIDDPPMTGPLDNDQLVELVDFYVRKGLSKTKAYARVAQRQSTALGRQVNWRALESRYAHHSRSQFVGKSRDEIMAMVAF